MKTRMIELLRAEMRECVLAAAALAWSDEGSCGRELDDWHIPFHRLSVESPLANALDHLVALAVSHPELVKLFIPHAGVGTDLCQRSAAVREEACRWLDWFSRRQLLEGTPGTGNRGAFADDFDTFLAHASRDTIQWRFVAPILNLRCERASSVRMGDFLSLRPLGASDSARYRFARDPEELLAHYCVSLSTTVDVHERLAPAAALDAVEPALVSLRVVAGRNVWMSGIWVYSDHPLHETPWGWRPFSWCARLALLSPPHSEEPVKLRCDQERELDATFRYLCSLVHDSSRGEAVVERYISACDKMITSPTDSLVDGVIALEALLLTGHGHSKKERLAEALALLAAGREEERQHIRSLVRAAYAARSAAVHGEPEQDKPVGLAWEVLDCLENAIRAGVADRARTDIRARH